MESFSPYLAGFFDGDGSLCFQIVRQREYRFGFYIRASFSLHRATRAKDGLRAIQAELEGKGYVRRRSGGMSDLVITQRTAIREILYRIRPYVVFKRRQVEEGLIPLGRLPPSRDPRRVPGDMQINRRLRIAKRSEDSNGDIRNRTGRVRAHGCFGPRND